MIDNTFIYLLFIGAILSVFIVKNGNNADLFTFPFLFPAVTVTFIIVEFLDFVLNAGSLFKIYSKSGAVTIALFMIASCSLLGLMGYALGYGHTPRRRVAPRELPAPTRSVIRYMHVASIIVGTVSFAAFFALASLAGGVEQYVLYSNSYSIDWRGLPVYLVFIVRLGYASIVIQLWLWVRTKRTRHLIWALVFAIIPLINIIFIFRRSEVVKLGIFFGYFLTNYGLIRIRRISALGALIAMYGIFKIFPLLRNEAGKQLGFDRLLDAALQRDTYHDSEIGGALFRIYKSMESSVFEYGAIFYNGIINQFVPGGLVGHQLKDYLLISTIEYADTTFSPYLFYLSPLGFAQAYQQFWLLGGLIFAVIGFSVARLERARFTNRRTEIFFVLLIPTAVMTVSADLALFLPQAITFLIVTIICVPKQKRIRAHPLKHGHKLTCVVGT